MRGTRTVLSHGLDHTGGKEKLGRWAGAVLFGCMALAILALVFGSLFSSAPDRHPVPAFSLPTVFPGAEGLTSEDLKGRISLVNIFASWCGECATEHTALMTLAAEGDLTVFGVSYKDSPAATRGWLEGAGNPYRKTAADEKGQFALAWEVFGIPETRLISQEGEVVYHHVGALTQDIIDREIRPIVRRLRGE